MNRIKKHSRIKQENATASSSNSRGPEEHDLAYFIHDRVELMHQVFSVLKSKELKALAPECVRRLSLSDLQELCLEELLGISSKRLCAILDGAEPPSDTESSSQSPEHLETISLDSISSDEEILSQGSKKKKHKHRHGKKKRRRRSRGSRGSEGSGRAARAGLTVLELLELQARARAIRAQLHQEPPKTQPEAAPSAPTSDNEVEIKEEPPDILEISSDDEPAPVKPETSASNTIVAETNKNEERGEESQTVTKRINDLIITVPQSKPTRKIKLKRQKPTEVTTKETVDRPIETLKPKVTTNDSVKATQKYNINKDESNQTIAATNKGKKNKKKKKKAKDKEGSDQDEITLQLSDTEKMDLLEDLGAKNFDHVSSSESSSSDSDDSDNEKTDGTQNMISDLNGINGKNDEAVAVAIAENIDKSVEIKVTEESKNDVEMKDNICNRKDDSDNGNVRLNIVDQVTELEKTVTKTDDDNSNVDKQDVDDKKYGEKCEIVVESNTEKNDGACVENNIRDKQKSDGEISDRDSSEIEASDVQPEIVCISDDEGKKKKKKKKEKKSKRDKIKDRKSDIDNSKSDDEIDKNTDKPIEITFEDDDVYEILEISDDSSCYEVDGVSVLSKEPTAEEIEAFSARMDEIEIDRVETVTPSENYTKLSETSDVENISWKDRYLGSKKVQRVLTTSNVLNAIRNKNKELKKKLQEAKKAENIAKEKEAESKIVVENVPTLEDGSIEQYEALQGSTKYVDPVKEIDSTDKGSKEDTQDVEANGSVTSAMKKDAKMLMKMYKRLLKYNDINKQKDPNKKKKKKQKKNKDKGKVNV